MNHRLLSWQLCHRVYIIVPSRFLPLHHHVFINITHHVSTIVPLRFHYRTITMLSSFSCITSHVPTSYHGGYIPVLSHFHYRTIQYYRCTNTFSACFDDGYIFRYFRRFKVFYQYIIVASRFHHRYIEVLPSCFLWKFPSPCRLLLSLFLPYCRRYSYFSSQILMKCCIRIELENRNTIM
jgi:hypothetical protein